MPVVSKNINEEFELERKLSAMKVEQLRTLATSLVEGLSKELLIESVIEMTMGYSLGGTQFVMRDDDGTMRIIAQSLRQTRRRDKQEQREKEEARLAWKTISERKREEAKSPEAKAARAQRRAEKKRREGPGKIEVIRQAFDEFDGDVFTKEGARKAREAAFAKIVEHFGEVNEPSTKNTINVQFYKLRKQLKGKE